MSTSRKWLITGVSGGFGRLLAEAALARGDSVAGTLRQASQAAEFEALAPGRAKAVLLDVTERARILPAVVEAQAALGGIDILVNNAGYGLIGALEELDEDEIDAVIETNLFGTIYITRAALPALRQSRGMIVNFSSLAGLIGIQGASTYCAAKHAVEGLTESLSLELAPFGIRTLLVEPGAFNTSFASSSIRVPRAPSPVYDGTPAGLARQYVASGRVHMRGDPSKAVAAILMAIDASQPPLRLLLGPDALEQLQAKLGRQHAETEAWKETTLGTDQTVG
jgi:NAD(P)-dependent dehydrogenase (short-subunit alcohol dehydrogenase family)